MHSPSSGVAVEAPDTGVDSSGEARPRLAFVGGSLGEALRGHSNSLGLIRLVLASLVIFDHAFPIGGFGRDPVWQHTRGQASLGSIAVLGFFAISGYLIAKSAASTDIVQYFWRRFLRIFPGYWAVLIFTAVVVGPVMWLFTGAPLKLYYNFADNGPVAYVIRNATLEIGTYGIHDLLATTTPYGRSVGASVFNGSIWTLTYEWRAYILIGMIALFGLLSKAKIVVPALAAFLGIVQIATMVNADAIAEQFPFLADPQRLTLTYAFLIGSSFAMYARQVPFDDRIGILSAIVTLGTLRYGGFSIVGYIAGTYLVFYLAARLPRACQKVGAKNDYSYGVYIYGFLVQQVLAYFGVYRWGYWAWSFSALFISLGFAWLSWHLVEKRAMALKGWGPGRGLAHWYSRILTAPRRQRVREGFAKMSRRLSASKSTGVDTRA